VADREHCKLPCLPPAFMLISCLAYSSTPQMEVICASKTLGGFQRTTPRYIPEDRTLHNHRCENLKSYLMERGCMLICIFGARNMKSIKVEYWPVLTEIFHTCSYTRNLPGETGRPRKIEVPDLNQGPPKYETESLTSRRQVKFVLLLF
jgi:hypothetical protein